MKKKELIRRVSETLRENNVRKTLGERVHTFHITDSDGNQADFSVRQKGRNVIYTMEDVSNILEACISVIIESIKSGEEVSIYGFGTLRLHHRAARRAKQPNTGEWCDVEARYVPKFFFGKDLRMAARLYELTNAKVNEELLPVPDTGGVE